MFEEPAEFKEEWRKMFETKFGLPFHSVKNIMFIGADTDDDELVHFIHVETQDIYTFDASDEREYWLDRNEMKDEILPNVLPILEKMKAIREFDKKTEAVRNEVIKCRDNMEYTSWRHI